MIGNIGNNNNYNSFSPSSFPPSATSASEAETAVLADSVAPETDLTALISEKENELRALEKECQGIESKAKAAFLGEVYKESENYSKSEFLKTLEGLAKRAEEPEELAELEEFVDVKQLPERIKREKSLCLAKSKKFEELRKGFKAYKFENSKEFEEFEEFKKFHEKMDGKRRDAFDPDWKDKYPAQCPELIHLTKKADNLKTEIKELEKQRVTPITDESSVDAASPEDLSLLSPEDLSLLSPEDLALLREADVIPVSARLIG